MSYLDYFYELKEKILRNGLNKTANIPDNPLAESLKNPLSLENMKNNPNSNNTNLSYLEKSDPFTTNFSSPSQTTTKSPTTPPPLPNTPPPNLSSNLTSPNSLQSPSSPFPSSSPLPPSPPPPPPNPLTQNTNLQTTTPPSPFSRNVGGGMRGNIAGPFGNIPSAINTTLQNQMRVNEQPKYHFNNPNELVLNLMKEWENQPPELDGKKRPDLHLNVMRANLPPEFERKLPEETAKKINTFLGDVRALSAGDGVKKFLGEIMSGKNKMKWGELPWFLRSQDINDFTQIARDFLEGKKIPPDSEVLPGITLDKYLGLVYREHVLRFQAAVALAMYYRDGEMPELFGEGRMERAGRKIRRGLGWLYEQLPPLPSSSSSETGRSQSSPPSSPNSSSYVEEIIKLLQRMTPYGPTNDAIEDGLWRGGAMKK